ncbi:MAG TPA: transglycosylase domain-containing protein, partial [Pyrinomonadaceae bacterium]|nr:transglycosylase domain-containing protein [Pyrinomonadaceae bacterium]
MPVRYPPSEKSPPVSRSGRIPRQKIVTYEEPRVGFGRRLGRRLLSAPVIIPLAVIAAFVLVVLVYYWTIFSARIDNLLRGDVYTRSAGIYAAPKQLRAGETLSEEDLIAYLKRAGYVDRTQQADTTRGRYSVDGLSIDIEPSQYSTVDGERQFQSVRVQFSRNAKSISSIMQLGGNSRLDKTWLEPELISSVTGQERAKRKVIGFNDLPVHLVKAITVTEDRSFFEHYGVNLRGILRALVRRYDNSDPNSPIARQGGSSITQQLVKNLLLSPERTLRRKVAEAYMSVILETRLSKEEIFALYCN